MDSLNDPNEVDKPTGAWRPPMPFEGYTPQFYEDAVNSAVLALMDAKAICRQTPTQQNQDLVKAAHQQHDKAKANRKAADQWALSIIVWPKDTALRTFMREKNGVTLEDGEDMVELRQKMMRDIWVIIEYLSLQLLIDLNSLISKLILIFVIQNRDNNARQNSVTLRP